MSKRITTAALLAAFAFFGAELAASANPPPITLARMRQRADTAIGYSYWWGGSAWDPNDQSWLGGCTGNCGNCSHRPSRRRNGPRENGPEWGADCSGYAGKVWMPVASLESLTRKSHPYVARNWTSALRGKWDMVANADTRPGDMRATRGHVYFVYERAPNGSVSSAEAQGCATGIVRGRRSVSDRFVSSRRRNVTGSDPDTQKAPEATDLRGPDSGQVGQSLNYCAQARDSSVDRVTIEFVFDGATGQQVQRSRPSRGGTQMCLSHTFTAAGQYQVFARAVVTLPDGSTVTGERSNVIEVTIGEAGEEGGGDWRTPLASEPGNGEEVEDPCRPTFSWSAVRVPLFDWLPIRYDIEVYDQDPRGSGRPRPVHERSLAASSDEANVSRGRVRYQPRNDLPEDAIQFWWHVRACLWSICTPWSSNVGEKRYKEFTCGAERCNPGGGGGELPAACEGVVGSGGSECTANADCGAGKVCMFGMRGSACRSTCSGGGSCGDGQFCLSAYSGRRRESLEVCDRPVSGEQECFCAFTEDVPNNCPPPQVSGGSGGTVELAPDQIPDVVYRTYTCE